MKEAKSDAFSGGHGGDGFHGGDNFHGGGVGGEPRYGPGSGRDGRGYGFGISNRDISNNESTLEGYNGYHSGTGRGYVSAFGTENGKNLISENPVVADEVVEVIKNSSVVQEEKKVEEKNPPLSDQQQAAIDALSSATTERPFPSNLSLESTGKDNSSPLVSSDGDSVTDGEISQAVLVNTVQFYKWFSDLESAMESETEEKYTHYVQILKERMWTCDNILNEVDSTLALFNDLQLQHQAVVMKTKTLHDACDKLLVKKQQLIEFADALRNKLNYFDELENFAAHFYSPTMSIENENFLPLLKRMDECISYIEENPQYAESSIYLVKFRQFQSRAFSMIRSHVVSVLKNASNQIQTAVRNSHDGKYTVSEGVEASVIYVRFKAAANEIKPVLVELESRSKRKDYVQTLLECHKLYCEHRLSLVKGIVHQRVSDFAKKEALPSFTRSGCAYLVQFCHLEHKLFEYFFPSSSEYSSSLTQLLDPLCTYFYDTLRPKFIHETNLDLLCELVDILKADISGETPHHHIDSMIGLRTILERILADVHGRLTFRARTHIRDEIANYSPSDEDLDYPGKLEQLASGKSDTISEDEGADEYKTWYPTLEKTLSCLVKLYRCLNPTVFTGLAQEAMEVCSNSIQKASKQITKKSSPIDGQLFAVRHLLIMREQIAPFDMEFSVTHKELDFSHLLEHLRRILKGQTSLFDWSRSTSLARTLSPRVLESQIDAKKDLEKALKSSCEEFIMYVTKLVVDPMLSFATKVTAVKAWERGKEKVVDPLMEKPIKAQAFANPEKVAEIVGKVNSAIAHHLPLVTAKMKLYLPNPSTRSILFRPIKTNIVEAHAQVLGLLRSSEYTEEEICGTNIMSIGDLQLLLDGHLL